ncbi:hypothetical protein [Emcibacter sp.]|uniref:hypothetical protein n=1 Tax=Emcibacter sp. TaxID=1979954 RepID=UPI003A940F2D
MNKQENGTEIRISGIKLEKNAGYQILSAIVDGERVWFRFPAHIPLRARPEIFVPFCLYDAMLRNIPIEIDPAYPVSPLFLKGFEEAQNIYSCWNSDLTRVKLIATPGEHDEKSNDVYCCYSGGIDSAYSYARHRDHITHLLLIQGFDKTHDPDEWAKSVAQRKAFANSEGKSLVEVTNNAWKFLEDRKLNWVPVHGSILACLGVTLGAETLYIPSSNTYNGLFPCGSHPLLDVQWGTENTRIIHDGLEASRSRKTEYIAQYQELLDQLQVCWYSPGSNCGKCSKCIRTSLILHILNKKSASLPDFATHGSIEAMKPTSKASLTYIDDFAHFTHVHGQMQFKKKLLKMRKKYIISDSSSTILKAVVGGWGRKIQRRFFPKPWEEYRAGLTSRHSILDK